MGKIIGITGGIASGKSTVTNFLRKQGFQVVDADAVVHQLQKPGGRLFEALVQHFGQEIILENGELNRPILASLMDIPLLFEQDYASWFDETWLVYVDRDVQIERLMKRDQLSKDEAEFRLAAQWPLEKKKDLASHVLNNNGNQDQLLTQVFSLLEGGSEDDRD